MDIVMGGSEAVDISTGEVVERLGAAIVDIDHVAIAVEDLDKAMDWYQRKLGFKLLEKRFTEGQHTSMWSAVLKAGSAIVVLIQGTSPESQVSRFIKEFGPGVQHIAFAVSDIHEAMRQVVSTGGKADTSLIEDEGIRQVFLRRDPGSGVRVELIERRGGSFSDKTVQKLFRAFEANDYF